MNTLLTETSKGQILLNLDKVAFMQELTTQDGRELRETLVTLTNGKEIVIHEYFSNMVEILHEEN